MKSIYFADPTDDLQKEWKNYLSDIKKYLKDKKLYKPFESTIITEDCPFFGKNNQSFDVLFFDYGGISMGNSILDSYCKYIINDAREHPSRDYVMISWMTGEAMEDILNEYGNETEEIPSNIYLNLESYLKFYKELNKKRSKFI